MDQAITVARLFTFLFPLVFMIANLGQAAILYVGGKQIIAGLLTLGEWQEFSLYLIYLFFPIAQCSDSSSRNWDRPPPLPNASLRFSMRRTDIVDRPDAIKLPDVTWHM